MHILAEISPGELVDKLVILTIKLEKITDEEKRKNIQTEYDILAAKYESVHQLLGEMVLPPNTQSMPELVKDLKEVNSTIWEIEDEIRECERNKDFGPKFIELARGVYFNNDKRSIIKRNINSLCESEIIEEKSYSKY